MKKQKIKNKKLWDMKKRIIISRYLRVISKIKGKFFYWIRDDIVYITNNNNKIHRSPMLEVFKVIELHNKLGFFKF